jgi:hypothetical protein
LIVGDSRVTLGEELVSIVRSPGCRRAFAFSGAVNPPLPIVTGLYSAFLARNESTSDRGTSNRPQSDIGFIRAA